MLLSTLSAIVLSSSVTLNPTPTPGPPAPPVIERPLCHAPPAGAPQWCKDCFFDACVAYIKGWNDCEGDADCRLIVSTIYALRLELCGCDVAMLGLLDAMNESQRLDAISIFAGWGGR